MTAKDDVRLAHLIDAATSAIRHSFGRTRADLESDELLRAVARMRDRLVHHYFDLNLDVLWETVSVDLVEILTGLGLDRHGRPTTEDPVPRERPDQR